MSNAVSTFSDSSEKTSKDNDEEDERAVLASINAALYDQAVYEDNVVRQASYQSVPQLSDTLPGFPAGMENELLLPLLQRSDIPASVVLHSILDSIQREQHNPDIASQVALLRVKEQIVFKLIGTISILDGNGSENGHREGKKVLVGVKNHPGEVQGRLNGDKNSCKIRRIPMMKRKLMEIGDVNMESATSEGFVSHFTPQKVEELKSLRALRRKKRQDCHLRKQQKQRGETIRNDDSSGSDELEMDNATVFQPISESIATAIDDTDNNSVSFSPGAAKATVSCPLCQNCIEVDIEQEPDAVLALHISDCQNSRSSRRRKPAASSATDLKSQSNIEETAPPKRNRRVERSHRNDEESTSLGCINNRGIEERPNLSENHVKMGSSPIDDIDEWNYEDRVDDWIVNGIQRMKVMKERDESEILPGDAEYEGGLFVPAWINNHLFSYQRDGVEWMWNLHQQALGGIIGDEMGLVCYFLSSFFVVTFSKLVCCHR
jgi:hypothetical protein